MRKFLVSVSLTVATFLLAAPAQAAPIVLTPGTPGVIGANLGSANCEPDCIEPIFGLPAATVWTLLYKQDVGGPESGSFASSYQTTFNNAPLDPADALIRYISGAAISCPSCYLAIKDGNQNPSYYFYNLAAWNGVDDIVMRDFWPNQGAISHVSIWGFDNQNIPRVPEPASMVLIGSGLLGLVARRRRQAGQVR